MKYRIVHNHPCTIGEGPLWWNHRLWFVDGYELAVRTARPETGEEKDYTVGSVVTSLNPMSDGRLLLTRLDGLFDVLVGAEIYSSRKVILATGHSARDIYEMFDRKGWEIQAKGFALGVRVEHPQSMINETLYGKQNHTLPAAPYKVTANFPNGRGVYSFCMCPGGYVVNSSSEEQMLVVKNQ